MYWGAIEIPWNYAIHRIRIFLLPASIYSVKPAQPDQAHPKIPLMNVYFKMGKRRVLL